MAIHYFHILPLFSDNLTIECVFVHHQLAQQLTSLHGHGSLNQNNHQPYHPLRLNTVLFGKSALSDEDNLLLFQTVQQYIKDTRRFE